MIHDATVEVTCDGENCSESVTISPEYKYFNYSASSGHYDTTDSELEEKITHEGWTVEDGKHFCESCRPHEDEEEPWSDSDTERERQNSIKGR